MATPTGPRSRPRVSLGLMTFGPPGSERHGTRLTALSDFTACLDHYQSRGYGEVDTARTYVDGLQEGWTRRADWHRRGLALATKWYPYVPGEHAPGKLREALETSLRELGADSVSIWYLHAPDRSVGLAETLEGADVLYREGKFATLGLSNYAAWEVAELCTLAEQKGWVRPRVYQAMYNCLTRAIEEELVPCCRRFGLDLLVYNPLAGGVLSGRYETADRAVDDGGRYSGVDPVVAKMYRERYFKDANFEALKVIRPVAERLGLTLLEVAFRWCVHHSALRCVDGNDGVVIGVSSLKQLQANLDELEKGPLPEEMVKTLDQAWEITKPTCPLYWR